MFLFLDKTNSLTSTSKRIANKTKIEDFFEKEEEPSLADLSFSR